MYFYAVSMTSCRTVSFDIRSIEVISWHMENWTGFAAQWIVFMNLGTSFLDMVDGKMLSI